MDEYETVSSATTRVAHITHDSYPAYIKVQGRPNPSMEKRDGQEILPDQRIYKKMRAAERGKASLRVWALGL